MDDQRLDYLIAYLTAAGDGFANNCILKPELLAALGELRKARDKPLHCPSRDGEHS